MCDLMFELEDIQGVQVGDCRLGLAERTCGAMKDLLDFVGETYQIWFLRRLIYGCCEICVRLRASDQHLLGMILWFLFDNGVCVIYDTQAGELSTCLHGIVCTSVQLSEKAKVNLADMFRSIWWETEKHNTWQKVSEEDGIVTALLVCKKQE